MFSHHIAEDDLEAYSLGRLASAASAPLEEHLLVCEHCQERLAGWDDYLRAMRAACRTSRQAPRVLAAGGCPPE